MVIKVAHDYICPWCWIAVFQTRDLMQEFGVTFDWLSYELIPDELPWPDSPSVPEVKTNRPKTPSRMDLAWAASGVEKPTVERPKQMRSHNALEATEYVKAHGEHQAFVEAMYRAYWEKGLEINSLPVIEKIAADYVADVADLLRAVEDKAYNEKIVKFDDESYSKGVYNVPTYRIGGERYAEQPTSVLRQAIRSALESE